MKKILVKAAMPIAPFNPNEVNDLSSLRLMPANRLSTYSMPIPLSDANLGFERRVLETGGEALPGFDETDEFGRRLAGTWAALPAYRYFAEPDVSETDPNRPMQLVGVLNQDPEWSAGRNQGRLESEGFYYGGVDPSLYRNMNLPPSMGREDLMIGARGAMLERGEDLGNQGFRRPIPEQAIRRQIENSKHHKAIQDALLALDLPAVGNLGMWKRPSIRDETDFSHRTWDVPPYAASPKPIQTGEPMDLSWRMLKAQQTIDAYSQENIKEGFDPETQNVIIASKPGAKNISAEEQSRLHDEMLRRISELEGTENMRIMSARGRSKEWGDENAFMLTNVPDDVMPKIHSLAEEFEQESILHSPKGMAGTRFVDSEGEVTGGLEEGEFTRRKPANYTEFPTGQKYSYGDYVAASEPMPIGDVLVKMPQEARNYATQIHEGQMYGEQPYMTHVEDVASGFDDPHLQRIAYLHDVVEDSETGIDEIHERFGEDIGHAVDALTRRKDEQYFDYINRVKEHPEATQVKLADLHSNLKNNPNESLAQRYEKAIQMLKHDILVKERVSPEAKRHKLEYDTAYEASPERRKYRANLNRERRRRGIYGDHSQLDVSHTEGGKLTIEPAHENRARHFKNRGTLRHVGVKKPRNE